MKFTKILGLSAGEKAVKYRLLHALLIGQCLGLAGCGMDSRSSQLADATSPDPFLVEAADPNIWYSKIFRAMTGSTDPQEVNAASELGLTADADFYVSFKKSGTGPDATLKAYAFRLDCPTLDNSFPLRAAFGQVLEPTRLKYSDTDKEFLAIVAGWRDHAASQSGPRSLACPTAPNPTASIELVRNLWITGQAEADSRIYLESVEPINRKIENLLIDTKCEDNVLKSLGFGSRAEPLAAGQWTNQSGSPAALFPSRTFRIAMPCTKVDGASTLKALCENASSLGSDYDLLYKAFRLAYAPGPNGANCTQFQNTVTTAIKANGVVNLSMAATSNFAVKVSALLELSLFSSTPAQEGGLAITDIKTLNLRGQKLNEQEMGLLLARFANAATPVTINVLGQSAYTSLSFLESIKNNPNVTVILNDDAVSPESTNCPVDGANPTVTRICLPTVPFYDHCRLHYQQSITPATKAVKAYLNTYQSGGELQSGQDLFAQCRLFTADIYKRKTLVLVGSNLESLAPFDGLAQLEALIVSGNRLQAASVNQLKRLPRLMQLDLAGNSLTEIPTFADSIKESLTTLDLSDNAIVKLDGIAALKKLRVLNLPRNKLTSIEGLGSLGDLYYLDVSGNNVFAAGLSEVKKLNSLARLKFLDIAETGLTTSVGELSNSNQTGLHLPQLISFSFSRNRITGSAAELRHINESQAVNKFMALVGFETGVDNLQAYEVDDATISTYTFTQNEPKMEQMLAAVRNPVLFHRILHQEVTVVDDPFQDVFLTQSISIPAPRFMFDPIATNCAGVAATSPYDAKLICQP